MRLQTSPLVAGPLPSQARCDFVYKAKILKANDIHPKLLHVNFAKAPQPWLTSKSLKGSSCSCNIVTRMRLDRMHHLSRTLCGKQFRVIKRLNAESALLGALKFCIPPCTLPAGSFIRQGQARPVPAVHGFATSCSGMRGHAHATWN